MCCRLSMNKQQGDFFMKIVILGLCLYLGACSANKDSGAMELKTYSVNPARAEALRTSLSSLLSSGSSEAVLGRVKIIDNDQLVVVAPHSIQKDVQALVEKVNNRKGGSTAKVIQSTLWTIVGSPIQDKNLKSVPPEIEEVLKKQNKEDQFFYIYDDITVRGTEGDGIEVKSGFLEGDLKYILENNKIISAIRLNSKYGSIRLQTTASFNPGQQTIIGGFKSPLENTGPAKNLYLIMQSNIE